jgi:hypothetical protein
MMEKTTNHALGNYQIAILTGYARWSGSDLSGKAGKWSSQYRISRLNLLARLRRAGHVCEIRDHKNENNRIMKVLYVDGVAVSATS